jgi:hypothetical protein
VLTLLVLPLAGVTDEREIASRSMKASTSLLDSEPSVWLITTTLHVPVVMEGIIQTMVVAVRDEIDTSVTLPWPLMMSLTPEEVRSKFDPEIVTVVGVPVYPYVGLIEVITGASAAAGAAARSMINRNDRMMILFIMVLPWINLV